jgi:uncharacterized protein YndB with AHSA1/START domain
VASRLAAAAAGAVLLYAAAGALAGDARAPTIDVVAGPGDGSQIVHAAVEIAAPPRIVWGLMTDPVAAPRLVVNMQVSRTVEHDLAGRFDVRGQISKGGLFPSVRTVVRTDYLPPDRIRFHRVDGDIKQLDGEWRLTPLDGGARTRLTYESRITPPIAAPGVMVRAALRKDMPRNLANLRDASEARAARP